MLLSSFFSCRLHGRRLFGAPQLLRLSACFSSSSSSVVIPTTSPPPKAHHFIVDFLIDKLGFSSEGAIKVSNHLSILKSMENPESFVGFMRSHGFSDAHIKKMVSFNPRCLLFNTERSVARKFQSLKDTGFSESDIVRLVNSDYWVLNLDFNRTLLPRIQFWVGLLGSRDHLFKILKKNTRFLTCNVDKNSVPNLSFLRSCGITDERIVKVLRYTPKLITQRPQALIAAGDRIEREMGITRSSGLFLWALRALHLVSENRLNASIVLMEKFGWSKADFLSAFRKAPLFLTVSQKMLARKMEFFLKEAGCKPLDVARRPVLLMYSLEKRLIPRQHVLKILKSRGLLSSEHKLATIMDQSEKVFRDKFVIPHQQKVPELQEIYIDTCGKGAPL